RDVVASSATSQPDVMLDVVRVTDLGDRFLRVRRIGQGTKPTLAALLPAIALLPQSSLQSGQMLGYAHLTLADGTLIGNSGIASDADYGLFRADLHRVRSAQFGLVIGISMEHNGVVAGYDDLRRISMVVTGVVAIIILGFALVF